jgi:hypothetical protein
MTEPRSPSATDEAESVAIEGYEAPTPGGWNDYPLDELAIRDERRAAVDAVRRIEAGRFVMDPDFQRGFVWDEKKQSRLVESILMRIPLPVFYVAEDSQGRLVVVDGRQRLTTLTRFLSGELTLSLKDRHELHGKHFDDLDERLKNRVEDCQLHFFIIDHKVPERARLDIFERVNGGEVLTRQQMRNAMFSGAATIFLRDEAATDLFRKATGESLDQKTMRDREFVNRFCSFSLLELDTYKGDMDDWLARGLTHLGKLNDIDQAALRGKFHRALQNNLTVFGKHAFRKHRRFDQSRSILNASLFDVMACALAVRKEENVDERAEKLRTSFYSRMDDERFNRAITYGPNSQKEVVTRFEIVEAMMKEVFDAQ